MKNKGMKLLSKIVAACFALILTISMTMPVQANIGKEETHKITVTGKDTDTGATVDVYRIIEVSLIMKFSSRLIRHMMDKANCNLVDKFKKVLRVILIKKNEVARSFEKVTGVELSNFMRKLRKRF